MIQATYICEGCKKREPSRAIDGRQYGPAGWLKNKDNTLHVCSVECAGYIEEPPPILYRERNEDGTLGEDEVEPLTATAILELKAFRDEFCTEHCYDHNGNNDGKYTHGPTCSKLAEILGVELPE